MELLTRIIDNPDDLYGISTEWDGLNACSKYGSPFTSYPWVINWCKHFLKNNMLAVIVISNNNTIVGIAPLYKRRVFLFSILEFIGQSIVDAEGVGFLIQPGLENEIGAALYTAIWKELHDWDAISYYGQRPDSISAHVLSAWGAAIWDTINVSRALGPARVITWTGNWDTYLKASSSNFKKNYRRHMSSLAENGFVIRYESQKETHDDVVKRMCDVESRSWQYKKGSRTIISHESFYLNSIVPMLESSMCDVAWLESSTGPVAFLLYFKLNGRAILKTTAYDLEYDGVSPGAIVHYACLNKLFDSNVSRIDLMTDIGPGNYKDRWSKQREVTYRHMIVKKTIRGRIVALKQIS